MSELTFIALVLVLGAAVVVVVVVVVVGERHVVPQLGHDQPHLARLQVEQARLVADLEHGSQHSNQIQINGCEFDLHFTLSKS